MSFSKAALAVAIIAAAIPVSAVRADEPSGGATLTEKSASRFVSQYEAAWAAKDGRALAALWHPEGTLDSPIYDRTLKGVEIESLTKGQFQRNPELTWSLIGWTWRKNIIVLEFETRFNANKKPIIYRGVDKMEIRNGRIWRETIYADTEPLRAAFGGREAKPLVVLPK